MSHTLFLLEGSSLAQQLAGRCRPLTATESGDHPLLLRWVNEQQMREIAWEVDADATVPHVVLETVAGETGAVLQELDPAGVRAALAALMRDARRRGAQHRSPVAVGASSRGAVARQRAGGVRTTLGWLPVGKAAVAIIGAVFFTGFLLGSYTALNASWLPARRTLNPTSDELMRQNHKTNLRLDDIDRQLQEVMLTLHQMNDAK